MKFTINRETLLRPLQLVAAVVERKQTMPVLSNILLVVNEDHLSLTGTDLEVELIARVPLIDQNGTGEVTVPARKLVDICKSLPENCVIQVYQEEQMVKLKAGRSRFTLSTLPTNEFPSIEEQLGSFSFVIGQPSLRRLIDRTAFSMAQQDVRYYLNGILLQIQQHSLVAVATDGHRLALCSVEADINQMETCQVIVPRKGILEMARLLVEEGESVQITLGANHIRAKTRDFVFTSKLVDGKFPDYNRVIPKTGDKIIVANRQELRNVFQRASILSNEKYRGVRIYLSENNLKVVANNQEHEEAKEALSVDYQGEPIEIGFNVSYLLDVLSVLTDDSIKITLSNQNSGALLEESEPGGDSLYVVMPMKM